MFTDNYLKNLKPQASRYDRHESGGFYVRIFPTGAKTFFFRYTLKGRTQRITIGNYPAMTLQDARAEYQRIFNAFKRGEDPASLKPEGFTVEDLTKAYIKDYAKIHKRSWQEDERALLKDVVPVWEKRLAVTINRSDVIFLLRAVLGRGAPRMSNVLLTVIRRMFAWAISHDLLKMSNPCLEVEPLGIEKHKDRHLSPDEIRIFWNGIEATGITAETIRALRLILVTGQRPGEVAGMHSDEIEGKWWTIPAERTKNKKAHRVYLSKLALQLIGERKGFVCGSSRREGLRLGKSSLPLALRRALDQDRKIGRLELNAFTPHDLRRTAATEMGALGFNDFLIGKILNHTDQSVTGKHYNLYAYDREKQELLSAWASRLEEIIQKPLKD